MFYYQITVQITIHIISIIIIMIRKIGTSIAARFVEDDDGSENN